MIHVTSQTHFDFPHKKPLKQKHTTLPGGEIKACTGTKMVKTTCCNQGVDPTTKDDVGRVQQTSNTQLTVSDHSSHSVPSLQPAVVQKVTSPLQAHPGNKVVSCLKFLYILFAEGAESCKVTTTLYILLPFSMSAADSVCQVAADFANENIRAIRAKFADFQTKVCSKLIKNGVDTDEFRLFLANQFPPGDCIPPPPAGLTEMFKAITHHGLWDYFHYSPLVPITKKFCAGDPEVEDWVQVYKQDLKAYQIVAKVKDYIGTDLNIADPPPVEKAKDDPRYNRSVEWKTKYIDHSLQYLADVWELFSYHYLGPDYPPTALLNHVRRGCLSVTWLVPSQLIPRLIKRVKLDTDFFQQHSILKVMVEDECVYEKTSEKITAVSLPWAPLEVFLSSKLYCEQYQSPLYFQGWAVDLLLAY